MIAILQFQAYICLARVMYTLYISVSVSNAYLHLMLVVNCKEYNVRQNLYLT